MTTNKKTNNDISFIMERTERKKRDKERSKKINEERHLKDIRKLQDIKTNRLQQHFTNEYGKIVTITKYKYKQCRKK